MCPWKLLVVAVVVNKTATICNVPTAYALPLKTFSPAQTPKLSNLLNRLSIRVKSSQLKINA